MPCSYLGCLILHLQSKPCPLLISAQNVPKARLCQRWSKGACLAQHEEEAAPRLMILQDTALIPGHGALVRGRPSAQGSQRHSCLSDKERKGVGPSIWELKGGNSRDFGRGNVRGLKVHEGETGGALKSTVEQELHPQAAENRVKPRIKQPHDGRNRRRGKGVLNQYWGLWGLCMDSTPLASSRPLGPSAQGFFPLLLPASSAPEENRPHPSFHSGPAEL